MRVAVVGGSIGGLAVANVLQRAMREARIEIFEAFGGELSEKGGGLAGVEPSLFEAIRGDGARLERRWSGWYYGDLWRFLREGLSERARLRLGANVSAATTSVDARGATLTVDGVEERYDLLIAADGQKSEFRERVATNRPRYSGYVLWRGMVSVEELGWMPRGIIARNEELVPGGYPVETFGYPVTGSRTFANVGFYVPTPLDEVPPLSRNRQIADARTPTWFLPVVEATLGATAAQLWRTIVDKGKVTPHPVWLFAADRVVNDRLALLGDAAHTATPRTARGAYTALVDAAVLGIALEQFPDDLDAALAAYNDDVVRRADDILKLSEEIGRRSFLPAPGVAVRSPASFAATTDT
eukprot:CAMPEP_0197387936 /NCGR_PEP_ID=MMETSP1165-20131217/793_1 /TAXON_ID=284809 /ORGANISM="Chrysocystis fragilis, Strain CCMP3189" /LENGTH=355 /DNA_ID=CAMNT_0042913269 /DNA_START=93 /DNA_END=1160 /DNA_ORIENTATION=+